MEEAQWDWLFLQGDSFSRPSRFFRLHIKLIYLRKSHS